MQSYCEPVLPRAGLGNMLLVWARARVFAHLNDMPLADPDWFQVRPRSWIRREKARHYIAQFIKRREVNFAARAIGRLTFNAIFDAPLIPLARVPARTRYVFNTIPHWSDYFAGIRDSRDFIRAELFRIVNPRLLTRALSAKPPVLSLHIRKGDFRELRPGEDFTRLGHVSTPLAYFVNLVQALRQCATCNIPVTVFSDGDTLQLRELLELPAITLQPVGAAIHDLLLMSRSEVIVTSAGSTFSYWAGFLSDAAVVRHPDHFHFMIRPEDTNNRFFEGPVRGSADEWPKPLRRRIARVAAFAEERPT